MPKPQSAPADPLSALIEAAVERVFARELPKLIDAFPQPAPAPVMALADEHDDRFVTLGEAADNILCCHRTTALRYEHVGKLPPRRTLGGRTGWLMSELRTALQSLPQARMRTERATATY
jgi:predicted DNA-binding transcriptional regulator AlpA